MGIDQPTPDDESRATHRRYEELLPEQKAVHNRESLHYKEGGYKPTDDETAKAEEMLEGDQIWQTEVRERSLDGYREGIEKLEKMGRAEFIRRSKELSVKIAEIISQIKDELIKEQQDRIKHAFDETQRLGFAKYMPHGADFRDYAVPEYGEAADHRDKIERTAVRLERGFEPAGAGYADPISIVRMPGNSNWPVYLFSKKSVFVHPQTTAEEMKSQIPEAWELPIYYKVWNKVESMLSPEERELAELIRFKQNEAQGVFEQ